MSAQDQHAAFRDKFRVAELHLAETGGWDLSLRPGQLTLGAMVLSLRSGAMAFDTVTPAEGAGMAAGFALAERLAKGALGARRINVLCLMMQDPIVHFHVLPRYDAPVARFGRDWIDADWPGPPTVAPCTTPDAVLAEIASVLRAAR